MWRKTRKPNYGTSCIGTDPNRNWGHKWGGECNWFRSFQLFDSCTTLCKYTLNACFWTCRAMQGDLKLSLGLRTRHSESDSIVRNPRSHHSRIHLCDRNPSFEIRNLIIREPNTFFEIWNLPVRIQRSESGISPSCFGIHHAESRTYGRDPGFNTRPYFYQFPLTLREQSMKQLFCHTFSSRCQQKSLSRWLSRLASIFRGRSTQRCQLLEFAEPTAQNCRLHGYSRLQPTLDDPLGIHKISNTWP